jgi:hypothetical protein
MLMEIPESVFQRLNASKHSIKTPPTLGQGRLAIFEAVHQIHCVKKLWEASYPDYYPLKKESEFGVWHEHIDHCADMLRQKLMCDADNNLITYNWVHNHYKPHPNFNVQHKCRSYDQLLEAVERHGIPHDRIPETGILRVKGENTVEFEEPPFDPLAE